jgi:hypothetical protein
VILEKRGWPTLIELSQIFSQFNYGVILAGGALRKLFDESEVVVDYDIFFKHKVAADKAREVLIEAGAKCTFKCPEGKLSNFKFKDAKVQFVEEHNFDTAEALLSSFDIVAGMSAISDGRLITSRAAIRDVLRKNISLNTVTYPNATLRRILKYGTKGYSTMAQRDVETFTNYIYQRGRNGADINGRFYID